MATKPRRGEASGTASAAAKEPAGGEALSGALDRLYAAPFDEFVARRKELAAELRAAGDAAGARALGAARKPARTAWALNQVARTRPELLRDVFEAHDVALRTQRAGDPEEVRATARAYRERITAVVRAAQDLLGETGGELNTQQARRVAGTMQAGATGGDAVRAQLLSGRLVEDVDLDDPFAGLEDMVPARGSEEERGRETKQEREREQERGRERGRERERQRERAAAEKARTERADRQRGIDEARRKVEELETKAREAVAAREDAQAVAIEARSAARRAEADVERAERAVEEAERRLARARAELAELRR